MSGTACPDFIHVVWSTARSRNRIRYGGGMAPGGLPLATEQKHQSLMIPYISTIAACTVTAMPMAIRRS